MKYFIILFIVFYNKVFYRYFNIIHQADDIGPILAVPSSFVVVTRTTGVPQ
jgi:hypothetical protein